MCGHFLRFSYLSASKWDLVKLDFGKNGILGKWDFGKVGFEESGKIGLWENSILGNWYFGKVVFGKVLGFLEIGILEKLDLGEIMINSQQIPDNLSLELSGNSPCLCGMRTVYGEPLLAQLGKRT